jgi:exodeoxyribonuclease VII large subunit
VGVITSPTGAVIRDMLHGFDERFPVRVLLWPVRVQGETSAAEVTAAIRGFNALRADGPVPRPDVLIVARGGGSLEDLWGFNDEALARAAAASEIPLISAVGHEIDWTLLDMVADARAPTPTKAAEWAVPKHSDLINDTRELAERLFGGIKRALTSAHAHLKSASRGLPRAESLVALPRQRLDGAGTKLVHCFSAQLQRRHRRFADARGRLPNLRALVAAPRQRFASIKDRLNRALPANTHAHAVRFARVLPRLHPRLLGARAVRARDRLETVGRRSEEALSRRSAQRRARFERIAGRLRPEPLQGRLVRVRDRLADTSRRIEQAFRNHLLHGRRQLDGYAKLLVSLSYQSVLERGFALVRDSEGRAVRSVAVVQSGNRLEIELADGIVAAEARETEVKHKSRDPVSPESRKDARPRQPHVPRSSGKGSQGTLF